MDWCALPRNPHRAPGLETRAASHQRAASCPVVCAGKVFFAKFDPKAVWFDDLEPLDGMQLPWEEAGLPRPCIDEPCQIDWINASDP